jgi:hypothetical protein
MPIVDVTGYGVEVEFPDDMPMEQINSSLAKQFPPLEAGQQPRENIYDADRNVVINAPIGARPEQIRFYDDVDNLGGKPSNYFGYQKVSKNPSIFEEAMTELALPVDELQLRTMKSATGTARLLSEYGIVDESAVSGFIEKMTRYTDGLSTVVQEKRKKSAETFLGELGTDVAVGLIQLPYYAAASGARGAALLYGLATTSRFEDLYQEALTTAPDDENKTGKALTASALTSAVEVAGERLFFKSLVPQLGEPIVKRIAKVAVVGGAQEAAEILTEDVSAGGLGIREKAVEDTIRDMVYSFAVGSVVGGVAGSVSGVGSIRKTLEEKNIEPTDELVDEIIKGSEELGAKIERTIQDDIQRANDNPEESNMYFKALTNLVDANTEAVAADMKALDYTDAEIQHVISKIEAGRSAAAKVAANSVSSKPVIPQYLNNGLAGIKTTPLNNVGEFLYGETGIKFDSSGQKDLLTILRLNKQGGRREIFVSNNPDLAIGQGENKGATIVYKSGYISGSENVKPATGEIAGREYLTNYVAKGAISEIRIDNALFEAERSVKEKMAAEGNILTSRGVSGIEKILADEFDKVSDSNGISVYRPKIKKSEQPPAGEQSAIPDAASAVRAAMPVESVNPERADKYQEVFDADRGAKGRISNAVSESADALKLGLEIVLTPISSRVTRINPKIGAMFSKFEASTHLKIAEYGRRSKPFFDAYKRLSKRDKIALDLAMKNGWQDDVEAIATRNNMLAEIKEMRSLLDGIYASASALDININYMKDYWPRLVANPKKFMKHLYKNDSTGDIQKAIDAVAEKRGESLSDNEKAEIARRMLMGQSVDGVKLKLSGNLKNRTIDEVNAELWEFYAPTPQAIAKYIAEVTDTIEQRKFFGKNLKKSPDSLQETISAYVLDEIAKGNIKPHQEAELLSIFKARFNQEAMNPVLRFYKNSQYLLVMGQIKSAVTQIGDVYTSLYKNGFYNTTAAISDYVSGKTSISKQDLGIDAIAAEFAHDSISSRAVDLVFTANFLNFVDGFGKRTFINSSFKRFQQLAQKPSPEFSGMLDMMFEGEAEQVLSDLRDGVPSENVKLLLFVELSKVQPISLSQMPEKYLNSPNGRVFYMLKTFTIRHIDMVRTETVDLFRSSPLKAGANLIRLAALFALMGATADEIKNLMLGRSAELSDLVVDNMLKFAGVSRYQIDQIGREGAGKTIQGTLFPPTQSPEMRNIPLVGDIYYWWFGKGAEKKEKDSKKQSKEPIFIGF